MIDKLQQMRNVTGGNFRDDRHEDDFYKTPEAVTRAILPKLLLPNKDVCILEPCCGDGAITKVLVAEGYSNILQRDIVDRSPPTTNGAIQIGPTFDATSYTTSAQYIITNPPFGVATEIFKNLIANKPKVLALLLRSHWLQAGKKRGFIMRDHPPAQIYALDKRADFTGKGNPTGDHAWFVWRDGWTGPTEYHLLHVEE